ncbi:hypothetical protein Y1Q_0014466 [Alligator mississippiensis]|uniref:Uncharacterized protein n=1 Tax=Alligator mississippiensis TaxID=8496 RepID=A0A151PCQ0_ALLMI|nr:hypothetical protein Y1Q_0014466 [Alligator mississippiensis]
MADVKGVRSSAMDCAGHSGVSAVRLVHPFTLEELLVKAEEQIQHGMDKGQTLTTAPHHTAYRLCLGCHPGTNSNPGKLHRLELVEKTLCNLGHNPIVES